MTDPKPPENPFLQDDVAEPAPDAAAAPFVDPVSALQAENAELKDKLLRTLAEMENLRRRTARDVHDGRTYAVTAFARDMLTVADNLARALDSAPKDAAEGPLKALIDGVDLTARDLLKALERHGVKKLEPKGQKFDPNFHQAIFEAPSDTVPAGMVSEVVQTGYAIGDRVLRPALVGVSKGAAKTEAPKPNGAGQD